MLKFKQNDIRNALIVLLVVFSSLLNFKVDGREVFLWMQILFCAYMGLTTRTAKILPYEGVNLWFGCIVMCTCGAVFSGMPASWVKAAVVMGIYMVPFYFAVSYLHGLIKEDPQILRFVILGIKIMCLIQLIWIPLQYIAYHYFQLDLNKILFYDILHMTATEKGATFIRDWRYHPSGMTWHSAILGPVFLLALLLFKKPFVKCIAVADVLICGNSTALVCVLLCLGMQILHCIYKGSIRLKVYQLTLIAVAVVTAVIVGSHFGLFTVFTDAIVRLATRLLSANSDASTAAHFAYFTDYPVVAGKIPVFQLLFGTGLGSSGYQYSLLYNRYTNWPSWAVECDVVDILISKGIVGFVSHYGLLIYIAVKGVKIDFRYMIFMLALLIGGVGYNIQFHYVIMIELLMFICIKYRINFFDVNI